MTAATYAALARRQWVGTAPWVRHLTVLAVALLVLFLRRPETMLHAEFWADDGPTYTDALLHGAATIAWPYAGYLVVIQRAAMALAGAVPPALGPVVANGLALLLAALVATFLASDRMALVIPDRGRRIGVAIAFLLVPGSMEVLGTLSHVQWVISGWLIAYAGATRGRPWELLVLAAVALTGPIAVFAIPVYALRWWVDRDTWPRLVIVAVAAGVQLVLSAIIQRPAVGLPTDLVAAAATTVEHVTSLTSIGGLLFLGLVLIAARRLPLPVLACVAFVAIAIPTAGMIRSGVPMTVWEEARYFWLSSWLVMAVIIAAPRSYVRTAAVALVAIILVTRFRLYPHVDAGWASGSGCIGGPAPCVVRVEPHDDWAGQWDVQWPGAD